MTLILDDLGREILGGAAERVGFDRVAGLGAAEALREAKVDQLDVAVLVEEQVLGLQVAIGDAILLLVQELEHEDDLGSVEAGHVLVEAAQLAEVGEELAAGNVVEQHIERIMVGEGGEQGRYEGVAGDVAEDGTFVPNVVDLLKADDFGFAQDLESVHFRVELMVEGNVGRGSGANEADSRKSAFCVCFRNEDEDEDGDGDGGRIGTNLCLECALCESR